MEELADISEAEMAAAGAPGAVFVDVAPLETGRREHVSFLDNRL